MNYIIFDLEFNLSKETKEERKNKDIKLMFEIIQIGAIKVDNHFKIISKFDSLVKPTLYTELHPYIENLTNITIDKLNDAKNFPEVYNNFLEFIGNDKCILAVWGTSDINELIKNANFHNLPIKLIPNKYIDIQRYASKYFNYTKGIKIGLKSAVEHLKIDTPLEFHNAFCDALYTYQVFKRILTPPITAELFNFNKIKRKKVVKEVIDFNSLFLQFEKIYNRKLTATEKEIIKTSYMMGRTRQFIKK